MPCVKIDQPLVVYRIWLQVTLSNDVRNNIEYIYGKFLAFSHDLKAVLGSYDK